MRDESLLALVGISKNYNAAPLLRDISFDVAAGEIVSVLGPSGTGKTTLLRMIAGLEQADAGRVLFEGKDLQTVPPHAREFGMMFQDLALFPHKNVFENVAFGLRMKNVSTSETRTRVQESLELVGLGQRFAKRDVNTLSGGEQQRVALARTLAPRPRLVMFDEPLGALDRILREELVGELRALLKRLHLTALYVTHDQDEAFAVADRLILLNAGRIQQMGAPIEMYHQPANEFVARFLGLTNLLEIGNWKLEVGNTKTIAETKAGNFSVPFKNGNARFVLLRPRAVERIVDQTERAENVLRGKIIARQWRGGHPQIVVETRAGNFVFEWDGHVEGEREKVFELNADEIQFLKGADE